METVGAFTFSRRKCIRGHEQRVRHGRYVRAVQSSPGSVRCRENISCESQYTDGSNIKKNSGAFERGTQKSDQTRLENPQCMQSHDSNIQKFCKCSLHQEEQKVQKRLKYENMKIMSLLHENRCKKIRSPPEGSAERSGIRRTVVQRESTALLLCVRNAKNARKMKCFKIALDFYVRRDP